MKDSLPDWLIDFDNDLKTVLKCRSDLFSEIIIENVLKMSSQSMLTYAQIMNFAALRALENKPLPWEKQDEKPMLCKL